MVMITDTRTTMAMLDGHITVVMVDGLASGFGGGWGWGWGRGGYGGFRGGIGGFRGGAVASVAEQAASVAEQVASVEVEADSVEGQVASVEVVGFMAEEASMAVLAAGTGAEAGMGAGIGKPWT